MIERQISYRSIITKLNLNEKYIKETNSDIPD